MLAAIGLILILKQLPHAIGYDGDPIGDFAFGQPDGGNTLQAVADILRDDIQWGAVVIAVVSLAFLFWWDKARPKEGPWRFLPGPLVVVAFGVAANAAFARFMPALVVAPDHLVAVPVPASMAGFAELLRLPDPGAITRAEVWIAAVTIAIVASLESLLSVKAVDELDPQRRVTDKNRELLAQGCCNLVAGLLGGIPVTSVIVRSSANVDAGAKSQLSTVLHAVWLLASVLMIPWILNLIPLSALAAVLIATGWKLAKPGLFVERYAQGLTQFIPFVVTVVAILFTDLLIGIAIGIAIGLGFVVWRNIQNAVTVIHHGENVMVRARRNLYFVHKAQLQTALAAIPDGKTVLIDCGPDCREQLLSARVAHLDAVIITHDHADHAHGIDDLRQVFHAMRRPVDVWASPATFAVLKSRFDYVFFGAAGYPATCTPHDFEQPVMLGDLCITPFPQLHGDIESTGVRFDHDGRSSAYSTDVKDFDARADAALTGLDLWVVDALRREPHPTHTHLEKTLAWITERRPGRAVLTHMDQSMDYETLRAELPAGVEPGYDGQVITL
jgi:MFS superfamily sulfate permease-like transporter